MLKNKSNQLHVVSRTQQDRHREPRAKTLCSPISRGGTQGQAFVLVPKRRNKNISPNGDRTHDRRVTVTLIPQRHN